MSGIVRMQVTNKALARANSALMKIVAKSPQAVARALNRTLEGMSTDAVRQTQEKYFVRAQKIRASIKPKKASAANLKGAIVSRDKRHSLAEYKLTPKSPRTGKKSAYKGAVMKEGGLKALRSVFLVKLAGGTYFPFVRVGSGAGSKQLQV